MLRVLIIPGFGETGKEKQYKTIQKMIREKGGIGEIISINWDRQVMTNYITEAISIVEKKVSHQQFSLLGFSFGAFIALYLAKQFSFKQSFICSCSPYFSENLKYFSKETYTFFGKRRMEDFKNYKISDIKNLKTKKNNYFFGANDWKVGISTMERISKNTQGSFILVSNTGHEINQEYIKLIKEKIR